MALTPERFGRLLDAGLKSVSVSLDGFEREHNYIRGNPRSYDRALEAVRMIVREPSLSYDVVTCVTGAMVPQLEAFRDMLLSEGVRPLAALLDFPDGACQERPDAADDRRPVPGDAGVHPPHAAGGPDRGQLCLRRLPGRLRGRGPRPFLPMRRGCFGGFDPCRRGHFGVHVGTAPTTIRETSTGIGSGTCGRTASSRSATANGRAGANAPDCSMFRYCQGGGMHLRGDDGELLYCHYHRL